MAEQIATWRRPRPRTAAAAARSDAGAATLLRKFPPDGRGRLYEQLARVLRRAIVEGHFQVGERLPSTRVLAESLGLSRNTVTTAYEILGAGQLTISHERCGTRVANIPLPSRAPQAARLVEPQSRYAARVRKLGLSAPVRARESLRYDLRCDPPFAAELVPLWRRKLAAAARLAGPRYPDSQGFQPLRAAISDYLARRRGVVCAESDILIVSGAQQAITVALRAVLNEGDTVAIEDPHYPQLLQALSAHGATVAGVRTDEHGMVTDDLARHDARLICVSPSDQFPTGAVMSLERRVALLDIASHRHGWILEDDYNSEFHARDQPIAALRSLDLSGRVIYVGTFSKTLFPALRLGYIVCPAGLRDDLCAIKRLDDLGSPLVEQAALAAFMRTRQFENYLRRSVAGLEWRRMVFVNSLRRHGGERLAVQATHGGTHVVVWLQCSTYPEMTRLIELAGERGLGLYPLHPYYLNPPERPGLLLGYAGLSADALERAGELLGECLDALERRDERRRL
jgi:GntR family transcriptional regulator/MocR family aminotransferase